MEKEEEANDEVKASMIPDGSSNSQTKKNQTRKRRTTTEREEDLSASPRGPLNAKARKKILKTKINETSLSKEQLDILGLFEAVDYVYCFLVKNRIPLRLSNVQSMVQELFPGRFSPPASFIPRMRSLAECAPSVLCLLESSIKEIDSEEFGSRGHTIEGQLSETEQTRGTS
ncbi:unnamed protein product [Choristocarpus tenellus]